LADAAQALARDVGRLGEIRQALRDAVSASPLGDVTGLTREIEGAYRAMWQAYCDSD
jgi:predicted O-linked N-acetylglucosamine transferase (SPINDLY family)